MFHQAEKRQRKHVTAQKRANIYAWRKAEAPSISCSKDQDYRIQWSGKINLTSKLEQIVNIDRTTDTGRVGFLTDPSVPFCTWSIGNLDGFRKYNLTLIQFNFIPDTSIFN